MMKYHQIALWLLLTVPLLSACTKGLHPRAHISGIPEVIPLKRLLAPESYAAPRLSPDGTRISYIAPLNGTMNLWVGPVDDIRSAAPVTDKTGRGIQVSDVSGNVMYRWTPDSTAILFPEDYDGDENWDLHIVTVANGKERNLTPAPGAKVTIAGMSADSPNEILVSINDRIPQLPDLHRLDLTTGKRTLVEENPGFIGFIPDHELKPRAAAGLREDGAFDLYKSTGNGEWSRFTTIPYEDLPGLMASTYQQIYRFDSANRVLFMYDSRGRDTSALVGYDLETDAMQIVAEDSRVDIGGVMYHPSEHTVQAYATVYTRKAWHVIDDAIAEDMAYLGSVTDGDMDVVSRSAADDKWIVRYVLSDSPVVYYLYRREPRSVEKLFVATPQLEGLALSKLHPVVMQSRDGFDLVSYVMLPPWTDPDQDGRPESPVPMVVLVHGGPGDERAQYAFGPFLHWLANRGYAVLYVNFRGSPGFGKAFMNAANHEWGGRMHEDVLDQVSWAIEQGLALPDRIGIMGGSYGGYETLVGVTMTPDVFACGVDLVGPANLEIPMPHWNVDMMARSIGDPRTEAGRKLLRSRSPINYAHQVKAPLLIGQGANDSRVPQAQSDGMVKVMTESGATVVYCVYPDEGHGLYRPENAFSFWAIAEVFLGQCLGGRYQPLSDELEGSSVQVPVGASYIPGLENKIRER